MTSERQLGFLWGAVSLILIGASPLADRLAATVPDCPIRVLLGVPCPSCGVTRAAQALAKLDFSGALSVNPLAATAWIGLVGGGLIAGGLALADRSPREPDWRMPLSIRWMLVLIVLVNWTYLLRAGV